MEHLKAGNVGNQSVSGGTARLSIADRKPSKPWILYPSECTRIEKIL